MFDAIAAVVDWSVVYLALAEVAIVVAGLWVAVRGVKAIFRFIVGSSESGGGWDYSQGDPDWETEQQDAGGGFEFIEAQAAGSTGTLLDPNDPDSPEYVPEAYESGPSGEA